MSVEKGNITDEQFEKNKDGLRKEIVEDETVPKFIEILTEKIVERIEEVEEAYNERLYKYAEEVLSEEEKERVQEIFAEKERWKKGEERKLVKEKKEIEEELSRIVYSKKIMDKIKEKGERIKIREDGWKEKYKYKQMIEDTDSEGLKEGVEFFLEGGNLTDFKAAPLMEAIKDSGGFKEGVKIILRKAQIRDEGMKSIAGAIRESGGLKEGVEVALPENDITDKGVKYLAEAIRESGGLKEWVEIGLSRNQITDEGVELLAEVIRRSGGLKEGVFINLMGNKIGRKGEQKLKELKEEAKERGINASITY